MQTVIAPGPAPLNHDRLPLIIQGGMGIGVSNWNLARAVSSRGQLGVVSGTAIDSLFVRRLQDGDPGGHLRSAAQQFPVHDAVEWALRTYYRPEGRAPGEPYLLLPMWRQRVSRTRLLLAVLASFAEVYLAKSGHDQPVGINLLTKVQLPNLATLFGAMLAGVDYVIMGAGIPREIPGVLDAFAEGRAAAMKLDIEGGPREPHEIISFDPSECLHIAMPKLHRPKFLPVVSAHSLALMLARKATGRVDGFIVEGPTAGGHNAPPRGKAERNQHGEPIYGQRDIADLRAMRELGLPFWLAGGTGSPEQLRAALAAEAAGIQVGTLFAYTRESGLAADLKRRILTSARSACVTVRTDPDASPTGFPFKVVELENTASAASVYERRERVCDLGYLRVAYRQNSGRIGYRCAAEPVDSYVKKGGAAQDTAGRKCLCNALMANVSHAQPRANGLEPALVTSGDDLQRLPPFARRADGFSVDDVLDYLLAR